jgi:hypothetical protein
MEPIRSHDELVDFIYARKNELGLSNAFVEQACNMTAGHCDKLLGPSREKNLSKFTLDYFFTLLAFELVPRPDPEQEARMLPKWEKREECQVRTGPRAVSKKLLELTRPIVQRAFGKLGNEARNRVLAREQRSEIARVAAETRWRRYRRMRKELAALAARARCENREQLP